MKNLKKMKLTQLSNAELEKREMNKISGGTTGACCICQYGSDNHNTNKASGLYSPSLMGTFTYAR